jgi:hypothetical protein
MVAFATTMCVEHVDEDASRRTEAGYSPKGQRLYQVTFERRFMTPDAMESKRSDGVSERRSANVDAGGHLKRNEYR